MTEIPNYLPELPDAEVPSDILAIYQELRRLMGLPLVPLLYRHLATLPGVLQEAWHSLAPLMRTGRLQDAAWEIARKVDIDPPLRLEPLALEVVGVDRNACSEITRLLDGYNRANPISILAVSCLAARIASPPSPMLTQPARPWTPPRPLTNLPPMTPLTEIPPRLLRLIEDLRVNGKQAPQRMVPSLYRHLTQWPGFLGMTHALLRPGILNGSLEREAARVRNAMRTKALDYVPMVAPLPLLAETPAARAALAGFVDMIPEMLVVGTLLRRALPDPT